MLPIFKKERMWRYHELKPAYDVVVVGAGAHGLGIGYYLGARHGIRSIAILEKGYLGCGNSGRNTAIIRSNYRTPEGIAFYDASVKLYEALSQELGWNVLFSQCGHLTLGHTDSAVIGLRVRAETNQVMGVESGKAMARTGLRMMPTFPSPPLKFRTAGFPRYGSKAGLSDEAFPAGWFAIVLRALC
jgi:glycine/D-amino acid oxidase-like deaminating enzyme